MKNLLLGLILVALSTQSLLAAEGFAVLPFIGTAHHKENLDIAADHVTKELQELVAPKGLSGHVVDYDRAKSLVHGGNYDRESLDQLCRQLGVRYLLFGDSKQIYIGQRFHRFNVYCKAFDGATHSIVDLGHTRHSSAEHLIEYSSWPVLRPKEWKTFSKLAEPFEVFVQKKLSEEKVD